MRIDRNLRNLTIISTIIGLVDSIYLTWIKLAHREALCLPGLGDCETVNTSRYAEIFGIPTALLGVMAYVVIISLLLLEDQRFLTLPVRKETSKMAVFGLSVFGVLYSAYLTYIEIVVLRAICPFCVISAAAMLGIFIFSLSRLVINQE